MDAHGSRRRLVAASAAGTNERGDWRGVGGPRSPPARRARTGKGFGLTHDPRGTLRSPGRGAPARPIPPPAGSTQRPRPGSRGSFGLGLRLGIEARSQELVHCQLRQAPAGGDRRVRPPRRPGPPSLAAPGTRRRSRRHRRTQSAPGPPAHRLPARAAAIAARQPRAPHFRPQNAVRQPHFLRAGPALGPAPPRPTGGSEFLQRRLRWHPGGRASSHPRCSGLPGWPAGWRLTAQAGLSHGSRTHR